MIPLADLVRMPKGTMQTYIIDTGDESYFLKKLSTYSTRAKSKTEHDIWLCIRRRDNFVQTMAQVKVIRQGRKLKRQKRHGA